jgi:hypothetical protein
MNRKLPELLKEGKESIIELTTPPTPPPRLGFDLDGTISEAPEFFRLLSELWPGSVYVITYRSDYQKAKEDVDSYGIKYEELILVDKLDGKADVITEKGITVYFDDQPEMLKNVPKGVQVVLFRNEGNFDFADQRWMMSTVTGKLV